MSIFQEYEEIKKMVGKEKWESIDELLNNDIKPVLVEKVSNTEKLAGLIIKILKVMGILFIVGFVVIILLSVFFW